MKKVLSLLLAFLLVLGLAACTQPANPTDATTAAPTTQTPEKTDPAKPDETTPVPETDPAVTYKKDIIIGMNQKFTTMDPQANSNGVHDTMFKLVFNSLVYYNYETGEMEPELAETWTSEESGKIWTFNLRKDVTFSNGEPFTSDDVIFTFERAKETGVSNAADVAMIETVEAPDDYTVKFTLTSANNDWLYKLMLQRNSILNREAVEKDAENGFTIGTGGWKLDNMDVGNQVRFVKFEDSWVWKERTTPTESITIRLMTEDTARLVACQKDEIQVAVSIALNEVPFAESDPRVDYNVMDSEGINYFGFNCESEKGSDENLRKAIAYALNVPDMLAIYSEGYGRIATTFWGPTQYGYYDAYEQKLETNMDLAKEYLAKSNYPNGVQIECLHISSMQPIVEVAQAQLAPLGIEIIPKTVDSPGLNEAVKAKTHEMFLFNKTCGPEGDQFRTILTYGNSTNRGLYNNERVMELLDLALAETDDSARIAYYKELQEITHEEMPYIPLFYPVKANAFKKGLTGVIWEASQKFDYTYVICPEE